MEIAVVWSKYCAFRDYNDASWQPLHCLAENAHSCSIGLTGVNVRQTQLRLCFPRLETLSGILLTCHNKTYALSNQHTCILERPYGGCIHRLSLFADNICSTPIGVLLVPVQILIEQTARSSLLSHQPSMRMGHC